MAQQEEVKKVLFVNKFGATSNAITGQTAKELADYLHEKGCDVSFLSIGAIYRANKKEGATEVPYHIRFIRDFYSGDSSSIRLIMSFVDGFRLWLRSLRMKSDVVIVMTEPPLLFFWFQLFRRFSKRKLFYWTMDMYPDAFAAGKFISERNIFFRFFKRVVYGRKPDLLIALGDGQRQYLEQRFGGPVPHVVIPCGLVDRSGKTASRLSNGKVLFGYAGNIGAAHDPVFLTELIKQLDPVKHEIILSLYGTKAAQVKKAVEGNPCIRYKEFLDHNDIAGIDINIASLLTEWNHVSVPSKAVTAACCGSAMLLNVPESADAWQMFSDAAWLVKPTEDYAERIRHFLEKELSVTEIARKKEQARELAHKWVSRKEEAYRQVLETVINTKGTSI